MVAELGLLILFLVLPIFISKKFFVKHHGDLLPSPLALPIIGHFHLLSPHIHRSFHDLSLRFGPIFTLRLGSVPCIVVTSPELAKEFLKTHELSFINRSETTAVEKMTYNASFAFAAETPNSSTSASAVTPSASTPSPPSPTTAPDPAHPPPGLAPPSSPASPKATASTSPASASASALPPNTSTWSSTPAPTSSGSNAPLVNAATPKPTRFSTRENPPPSPPSLAPPLSAATSTHPAAAHYSQGYIGHFMSMLQVSS